MMRTLKDPMRAGLGSRWVVGPRGRSDTALSVLLEHWAISNPVPWPISSKFRSSVVVTEADFPAYAEN
jgi:hypothetical protein